MLPDGELAGNIISSWYGDIQPQANACNHEKITVDVLLQLKQQVLRAARTKAR